MALLRNKMYLFRGKKERMSRERETEKAMKPPRTKFPNFEKGKSFLFFPFSPAGRKKTKKTWMARSERNVCGNKTVGLTKPVLFHTEVPWIVSRRPSVSAMDARKKALKKESIFRTRLKLDDGTETRALRRLH